MTKDLGGKTEMKQKYIDGFEKIIRTLIAEAFKAGRMSHKTGKNVIQVMAELDPVYIRQTAKLSKRMLDETYTVDNWINPTLKIKVDPKDFEGLVGSHGK